MSKDQHQTDADDALMARLASGDHQALEALFVRHRQRVFALAYRYAGDRAEAEDLTQETFIRVLDAAHRYRAEGTFRTWLLTITTRLCLKKRARHASWKEHPVGLLHPSMERPGPEGEEPADGMMEKERAEMVRKAVMSLPADQRMAILLSRFEGLSYQEIAAVMEKSVQSVTSLLWRARERLRVRLAKTLEDGELPSADAGASFFRPTGSR